MLRCCYVSGEITIFAAVIFNLNIMISLISRQYGKGKECLLSIRVKNDNMNTAVALNISVSPQLWIAMEGTIRNARKAYRRGTSIFIEDQLTAKLWMLIKRLIAEDKAHVITRNSINEAIRKTLHADEQTILSEAETRQRSKLLDKLSPERHKPSFHEFLDNYINELTDGSRLKQRSTKRVAKSTIAIFSSVILNIGKFEEQEHVRLDWQDMNAVFFQSFKSFLTSKNLKQNTIIQYLQKLGTILRAARLMHYTVNDDINITQFCPAVEETENVYLPTERIIQLYNARLTDEAWIRERTTELELEETKEYVKSPRHRTWLAEARDIFVVGCLTGQRYSDYIRINERMYESYNGRKFIHLRQEKTDIDVYIPLSGKVQTIVARHGGKIPYMDRKKLIRNIRVCGQLLGWNEPVSITVTKGSFSYDNNVPFYRMLKTHTCRRSFATNAYRAKVPLSAIMAVTGHASEEMLRKYLKLKGVERALFAAEELSKMQTS